MSCVIHLQRRHVLGVLQIKGREVDNVSCLICLQRAETSSAAARAGSYVC